MKKTLLGLMAMVLVTILTVVTASTAMAGKPETAGFNWGDEVNAGQCPDGQLVINVTHKVTNDIDLGDGGGWATDAYKKHIQVWQVDEDTFCAIVRYIGSFVTREGRSPADEENISDGIKGTMQGGYRLTVTGALQTAPASPARGNLGTFDYVCIAARDCPGLFDWKGTYFDSGYSFTWDWWGYVYRTGRNGTWVNSDDGNEGDITD